MSKEFNLAGKDWFTEQEAAFYCCVSASQFAHHYEELGITPRRFMGRKLYSREELSAIISRSNPWHTRTAADRQSLLDAIERGRKEANAAARHAKKLAQGGTIGGPSAPYRNLTAERLRPYKPRKKAGP